MTRKAAVLAVVALVVAGTSAALAVGGAPTGETSDAPLAQETTTTEGMGEDATASVIFLNQTAGFTFTGEGPNTTTVLIERVVVPEGGFLVIHQTQNVTGEYASADNVSVGQVVGNSTYLEPGDHSNVVVELDESINESQTLVAMPHRDTNDNQQYDFPEADDPYTFEESPVIETAFVIVEYDVIEGVSESPAADGEERMNETTTEA